MAHAPLHVAQEKLVPLALGASLLKELMKLGHDLQDIVEAKLPVHCDDGDDQPGVGSGLPDDGHRAVDRGQRRAASPSLNLCCRNSWFIWFRCQWRR